MPGFLDMLRAQVPELIRGSIVAAGSPTPGAVGTAQDIFGGFRAAQDDKQQRDMLRIQLQRQAAQDALKRREFEQQQRLEEARIKEYEAQARRYDAQATAPSKPPVPEAFDTYMKFYAQFKQQGMTERDASNHAQAMTIKQTTGLILQPPKGAQESAQRLLDQWHQGVITEEQYRTEMQKVLESSTQLAKATAAGTAAGKPAFIRPQIVQTPQGPLWVKAPDLKPGASAPVADEAGKPIAPKPEKPRPFKTTAADRNQAIKEKVATVGNALLLENGGDRSKAASAAIADPRAKGINKQVQDWLVPPQKGNAPKKSALDEYLERRAGKSNTAPAPSGGGNPYRTAPK